MRDVDHTGPISRLGRLSLQWAGTLLAFSLIICGGTHPAHAQIGAATPDNANKLTFEALTATPPPPRPVYHYHPRYYSWHSVSHHEGSYSHGHSGHSSYASHSSGSHHSGGGSSSHHAGNSSHRRRR